jgi:hypothetical protein
MILEANGTTRGCLPSEGSWPMPRPAEDDGRR